MPLFPPNPLSSPPPPPPHQVCIALFPCISFTLTYRWVMTTRPTGSTAALSSASASKPTFTADVAGIYVMTLVVNDGKVDSSNTSTVAVRAS